VEQQITRTGVSYRRMTEQDLAAAHRLTQALRWPHRLHDWQLVYSVGTGYVAEAGNTIVGTTMCWRYGADYASIGMVIVDPLWQGKGIGRKLMDVAMEELGERTLILNATAAGQPLYERLGFVPTGGVSQHQGSVFLAKLMALAPGERIRPLGSSDSARLSALAARAAGLPRATVLATLMESAECVVIDRDDDIIGCAVLRRFGLGYAIGPVIAPDIERAKALIGHWIGTYAGAFVRIDVHADSGLGPWLDEQGLLQVGSAITMVRGAAPLADATLRQFAIISQALG
jgi:predicted N-acetyltransferase YhbS